VRRQGGGRQGTGVDPVVVGEAVSEASAWTRRWSGRCRCGLDSGGGGAALRSGRTGKFCSLSMSKSKSSD
jgi:hypothetical protein